jgi:diphosphoinositol-polyphosphate diphosphatase
MGKPGAARPRVVCCALPLLRSSAKVLVISSRKRDGKWVGESPPRYFTLSFEFSTMYIFFMLAFFSITTVPKGGYEASDKTLEAAAAREAYEEGRLPHSLIFA